MITERLERREERALIHSRLWSHTLQQTECTSSFLQLRPIQAEIKTFIALFEKCKRIYGLKVMKSEFKKAGTLQLRESVVSTENCCVWETRELMDGGYLWRLMWILWMTSLSSHSTSASVSELSRLVTHTAVSSPKCNSETRPLSNGVVFRTLFKRHIPVLRYFKNSYHKKNKHRYSVWTGILPSTRFNDVNDVRTCTFENSVSSRFKVLFVTYSIIQNINK